MSDELHRLCDKLHQASEVLSDGSEHELVLCATRATQQKSGEAKDALQVREPHLDALAVVS